MEFQVFQLFPLLRLKGLQKSKKRPDLVLSPLSSTLEAYYPNNLNIFSLSILHAEPRNYYLSKMHLQTLMNRTYIIYMWLYSHELSFGAKPIKCKKEKLN